MRLLGSRREQRRIIDAVALEGTRRRFAFLIEDCCEGRPEICGYGRMAGGSGDDRDRPQPGRCRGTHAAQPAAGESQRRVLSELGHSESEIRTPSAVVDDVAREVDRNRRRETVHHGRSVVPSSWEMLAQGV